MRVDDVSHNGELADDLTNFLQKQRASVRSAVVAFGGVVKGRVQGCDLFAEGVVDLLEGFDTLVEGVVVGLGGGEIGLDLREFV